MYRLPNSFASSISLFSCSIAFHLWLIRISDQAKKLKKKELNEDKISAIRDKWKGKIVLKGVASEEDTRLAIKLGLDGIIVSNHGGRQLDARHSSIKSLEPIVEKYKGQIKIMMDSAIQSGPDIARTLASGEEFAFLGRAFMYGVAALGKQGGNHTISMLKTQLNQVMEQVCCHKTEDFYKFKVWDTFTLFKITKVVDETKS